MTKINKDGYEVVYKGAKAELEKYFADCSKNGVPGLAMGNVTGRKDIFAVYLITAEGACSKSHFPIIAANYFMVALQEIIDNAEFTE